ncbi:hypothetical protein SAMN05444008_10342 [Cnuella takakiae]|uniref:Uncharacterized protein n=1 Tax=Cnuella takakiae TaxID=1302690 RepID=A0A1M4WIR9_9BACT|nr:hypothetical protein [Cnuella takakiae]OLY91704.1 hypothetical protein BUE76_07180 [Cnuella takakiae]SHE81128.1 hypothetical protein SAMN05444008_10342 [Cnuella takakiae]
MLQFRQNLYTEEHNFSHEGQNAAANNGEPSAAGIGTVELRLSSVVVQDNNTPAIFPYPGYAKLYLLCIVATSAAAGGYQLHLRSFDQVADGDALNMDKTIYYWKKDQPTEVAPVQIHVFTSLIKSKQPLRDVAAVLSELYRDASYKLLTATLDKLIKGATPIPDISNLLFNIAGIAGKYLEKVDDRPLLTWYQSFTGVAASGTVLGKTEKMAANCYVTINLSMVVRNDLPAAEEPRKEKPQAGSVPLLFPYQQ